MKYVVLTTYLIHEIQSLTNSFLILYAEKPFNLIMIRTKSFQFLESTSTKHFVFQKVKKICLLVS